MWNGRGKPYVGAKIKHIAEIFVIFVDKLLKIKCVIIKSDLNNSNVCLVFT